MWLKEVMILVSPLSEEGQPVVLSTEEASVHFRDVASSSTASKCHHPAGAESWFSAARTPDFKNSMQHAKVGIYTTFILISF